jgi:large subunit ribosomal protein L6
MKIEDGVTVTEREGLFVFKGPKGEKTVKLLPHTNVKIDNNGILVTVSGSGKQAASNVGTMFALLRNTMEGVKNGFEKVLELEGVGYKAAMEGPTIVLTLGFANPIKLTPPTDVTIVVDKNRIKISGADKEAVGQTAAKIRSYKKPEPYKGKGIHYLGEVIARKVGKKAGTAAV